MQSIFDLKDRVAVVTGANGKLGSVWVEALLEAGASVFCIDLETADSGGVLGDLNQRYPNRITSATGDITDRESIEKAFDICIETLGEPSILVNNAGLDQPPTGDVKSFCLEDYPAEMFAQTQNVNTVGTFIVSQVFVKRLTQSLASIINIGSLYASVSPDVKFYDHFQMDPPFIKPPGYGPSKEAVINLSMYMATHWASKGVRVNTLSPGGVKGGQDGKFIEKFCSRVPMVRMAELADLKGPLVFLASEASSYVTGIELRVDGGFTAW